MVGTNTYRWNRCALRRALYCQFAAAMVVWLIRSPRHVRASGYGPMAGPALNFDVPRRIHVFERFNKKDVDGIGSRACPTSALLSVG